MPAVPRLFTMRPDYQDYFEQFRGLSLEEVAKTPKLRAHGSIFMHSLSSIVDNPDDLECAAEIMRKKVQSHWPRGMRREHYVVSTRWLISDANLSFMV